MKNIMIILIALFFSAQTFGGAETGHGGGAVECIDPLTGVKQIELLDLYMGEAHGFTIDRTNEISVEDQIKTALKKIKDGPPKSDLGRTIQDSLKSTMNKARMVMTDEPSFPVPTDAGILDLKENCKLVGVALYKDNFWGPDTLKINYKIYSQLTNTDKAALWIHEDVYALFRSGIKVWSSVPFQRFVAVTFSRSEDYFTPKWPPPKNIKIGPSSKKD